MADDLSLIKFNVVNFHSVLINSRPFHPVTTIFIKLVNALLMTDETTDKADKAKVDWIYNNTHEKVKKPLPIIEYAVFKNLDKALNKTIDIGEDSYNLIDLYKYLDQVSLQLTAIVIKIAKKYNVEIPVNSLTGVNQKINLEDK